MGDIVNFLENLDFNIALGNLNIKVVSLVKVDPDENWFVTNHSHADYEFHIIPQGKGYINIEGHDMEVNGSEFYITGPYIQHKQVSDRNNPMSEYCLECEINILENIPDNFITSIQENRLLKEILSGSYPCTFKDIFGIAGMFEEIFKEAEGQKVGFILKIQTLIISIVGNLFRAVALQDNVKYEYKLPLKPLDDFRSERLVKFMELNYKNSITLEEASNVLYLSPRQINRLMKKVFKRTFHDYLQDFRLKTAERLLKDTMLSIEEIAYESGFSSHYYMYQAFKRKGLPTPAKIRSGNVDTGG